MKDDRLDFMIDVAYRAGDIIMGFWGTDVRSRFKDDKSVVTEADMRSSEFVQREIARSFPSEGILNEEVEGSLDRLNKPRVWIVDPLDGSGDFKRKEEDFCFLLAHAENGTPTMGVVYEPLKKRLFYAQQGQGAFMSIDKQDAVRLDRIKPVSWEGSLVGHPKTYKGDKYSKLYGLMGIPELRLMQSGSMGTRMMQVALQQTHMILGYTQSLKEWDIAAGHVVLQEAGISVSDMFGDPLRYNQEVPQTGKGILVVHPDIKTITLERLAQCYSKLEM